MTARPPRNSVNSGGTLNTVCRIVNTIPPGTSAPARHGAADAGDAAEIGEREDDERLGAAEVELVDAAEAVADSAPPIPAMNAASANAVSFVRVHVDAGAGGGPLVRTHREEAAAGGRPPEVDDHRAQHDHRAETEHPEPHVGAGTAADGRGLERVDRARAS